MGGAKSGAEQSKEVSVRRNYAVGSIYSHGTVRTQAGRATVEKASKVRP